MNFLPLVFYPLRTVRILFGIAALSASCGIAAADDPVYPGSSWAEQSPADAGLDVARLNQFRDFVGGRGCVVRHGYMVYTWGDAARRGDVASAAKPWYTHFLIKALEDGKIDSLDERIVRWEPRLNDINPDLDHKDRLITWRHCANQISCYQLVEKPGTAFDYNDWQMALFWDTLFLKVYGATYDNVDETVLRPLLADVLQCEDQPTFMAFGTKDRPGRLAVSPRDFARFGLLYLRKGRWRDAQLISREHAEMAVSSPLSNDIPRAGTQAAETIPGQRSIGSRQVPDNQTDHFGSYSWLWWLNGIDREGKRHWPDVPHDVFCCSGHGGPRFLGVFPGLDLIVSWNDVDVRSREKMNDALALLVAAVTDVDANDAEQSKRLEFRKWSPIELTFHGPDSAGRGEPNPFMIDFDVDFTGPSGQVYRVPGFYDGDGGGGLDGDIWKVRFSADEEGVWSHRSRSEEESLNGHEGRFDVTSVPADARSFWAWGRLEASQNPDGPARYLKFRDGPWWLKAGCDDPENFLGNYENYGTLAQRVAAVDYLAERGINSLYIMTHNIDGDDRDVWPWLGETPREAKSNAAGSVRFDPAKLEEWRLLFEHMQTVGVVPYLVLEDDSAWTGYDHDRYDREIIARFGYLPALLLNIGEENNENYRLQQGLALAQRLAELDPYDHPRGIHNVNEPNDAYIDASEVDFTSIQTGSPGSRNGLEHAVEHNRITLDWLERSRERGRRALMINFDEGRPELDRRAWWSAYLAGGVWEAHVPEPYDRPYSHWETTWKELGGARAFMETLPFHDMQPHNELVTDGQAFCLARPGDIYALHLPTGGSMRVNLEVGRDYDCAWWNPANGTNGEFQDQRKVSGGFQEFAAPADGDRALRIAARR